MVPLGEGSITAIQALTSKNDCPASSSPVEVLYHQTDTVLVNMMAEQHMWQHVETSGLNVFLEGLVDWLQVNDSKDWELVKMGSRDPQSFLLGHQIHMMWPETPFTHS